MQGWRTVRRVAGGLFGRRRRVVRFRDQATRVHGRVHVEFIWAPGTEKAGSAYLSEDLGSNLVVDLGRETSARLLGGGPERNPSSYTAPDQVVNWILLGGNNPAPPDPESASDSALTHPISPATWKAIGAVTYPSDPDFKTVRFSTIYGEAEANFTLNEAGLYIGPRTLANPIGATLYARKTFGNITKTADFLLTFNWDIEF